jgi:prolyl-tRNA editing enzyme YbaK/EbsC (Cys-tRNA(Pro) deacylase)
MQPAAARVQETLRSLGVTTSVMELSASARTAAEAAAACGVAVGQIVKSLVFVAGDEAILVLVSGANQADEGRLRRLTGQPVRRADADTVRRATGFAIGGVPPVGHPQPLRTLVDRDLLGHDRLIAAAGTPHAVFPLTPGELLRVTGGQVVDLKPETDGTRPSQPGPPPRL